jgi:hypothetical protein
VVIGKPWLRPLPCTGSGSSLTWVSHFLELWEINFCCSSDPVYGILWYSIVFWFCLGHLNNRNSSHSSLKCLRC